MIEHEVSDDVLALFATLPPPIVTALSAPHEHSSLLEVVMDLGREPMARFRTGDVVLSPTPITQADIDDVVSRIGMFGDDNRAGIPRTLHRISAIRNRQGKIIGLTCRVGRAVVGTIAIIQDLVESGKSILLLGRPGVGKTTMLREVARVLADDFRKRVVIVDTSNEIAGDGDIPHPGIGRARRMQVATPISQHAVMIEAVENHMPEVIIIDEIGTELEAHAARTIAERGVQLVGTAHGNTLHNLMQNPTLSDLIGGIQTVTLGDEEARRRGTQKSVLERKAPPTFDVIIEIQDWYHVTVHPDVANTVDGLLLGRPVVSQIRERDASGVVITTAQPLNEPRFGSVAPQPGAQGGSGRATLPAHPMFGRGGRRYGNGGGTLTLPSGAWRASAESLAVTQQATALVVPDLLSDDDDDPIVPTRPLVAPAASTWQPLRLYPFGVSRTKLEEVAQAIHLPLVLARDMKDADVVITLKNYFRKKSQLLRDAETSNIPIHVLKSNTAAQIEVCLLGLYTPPADDRSEGGNAMSNALQEAENAITHVMSLAQPIDLTPQNAYVRRLQHRLAERYNLPSRSRGRDPYRRVRIFPGDSPVID